jgi:hypothetical protein
MTTRQDKSVTRLLHDAHLRYQRQAMRPDKTYTASSEIRGVKRQPSRRELDAVWLSEWTTGLRPNFWKAYFDTLSFMTK